MADLTGMMQAAAGAAGEESLFIEDVFSTFLYTGTGSTQTITNNIDLDGEGGLVWIKSRSAATDHQLFDTERGATKELISNSTAAEAVDADTLTGFNANGFALGADSNVNTSAATYCSWTFRKAPKFFDVVTYTGTGSARTVAHNLGSVPGCMIVKRTNLADPWRVYHRSLGNTEHINLNTTEASSAGSPYWNSTTPTSTVFTVGSNSDVNASGSTYVAYLFAHDDGGFGDDGLQNVVSCGGYTGTGGALSVNLGYEPQWLFVKRTNLATDWNIVDNMRGFTADGVCQRLEPNTSDAEATSGSGLIFPTATGFGSSATSSTFNNSGDTYIYIAIRRGPMKTPESGTEVFAVNNRVGASGNLGAYRSGFPVDMAFHKVVTSALNPYELGSRLTQGNRLNTTSTAAESASGDQQYYYMDGWNNEASANADKYAWMFRRAPGFFDVVCTSEDGSFTLKNHNLGVKPDLIISKRRSGAQDWSVSRPNPVGKSLILNSTAAEANINSPATSTTFAVAGANTGETNVAYLFASLAGVSDIGTYTGNGTSVSVTTGFQPRFILVKRTDSTGNWIVGDSARGLVAADEPALFLNTTAAETTGQDWVDVSATGFTVNETALNANVSTATYLYLAIS
jgi:hypothetical protein